MTKGKNESMSYSFKSVENNGGLMAQGDYLLRGLQNADGQV